MKTLHVLHTILRRPRKLRQSISKSGRKAYPLARFVYRGREVMKFAVKSGSYREVNTFKADRQDGTGFDMDLFSIDTIYHRVDQPHFVTYASRDFKISALWLTRILQRVFGK